MARSLRYGVALIFIALVSTSRAENPSSPAFLCAKGRYGACVDLGDAELQLGKTNEAFAHFDTACQHRVYLGCSKLGFERFDRTEKKSVEAEKLYQLACAHDDAFGCFRLGWVAEQRGDRLGGVPHYVRACQLGNEKGCENAGFLYKVLKQTPNAVSFFRQGCVRQREVSCAEADALENKPGAKERLKQTYQACCARNQGYCCSHLAALTRNEGDIVGALTLYKRSCELGFMAGCHHVSDLEASVPPTSPTSVAPTAGDVSSVPAAAAAPTPSDPYKNIRLQKLANGLLVLLLPSDKSERTLIQMRVRAGTETDLHTPAQLAHLTEHTLFRDEKMAGTTYLDLLMHEGADANGITASAHTLYYASVPSAKTKWVIDVMGKMLRPRHFSAEQVRQAKAEIAIEASSHGSPGPTRRWSTTLNVNFLDEFGLSSDDGGFLRYLSPVRYLTTSQVQHFYDTYYHPANMVLILVGNFAPDQAMAWIQENFSSLSSVGKEVATEPVPHPRNTPLIMETTSVRGTRMTLGTKFWKIDLRDQILMEAYFRYLSQVLMKRLRSEKAATYTVNYLVQPDTRNFGWGYVTLDGPARAFEGNLETVDAYLNEARDQKLSESEVNEMKAVYFNFKQGAEKDVKSLLHVAEEVSYFQETYGSWENPNEMLAQMPATEVRSRLAKLLSEDKQIRILFRPPLLGQWEGILFFLLAVIGALYFARSLLLVPGNEVREVEYVVSCRYGVLGRVLYLAGMLIAIFGVEVVVQRVMGSDSLRSLYLSNAMGREFILRPSLTFLEIFLGILVASRFIKRVFISNGGVFIARSAGFASSRNKVTSIRTIETRSLWRGFRLNPLSSRSSYFGWKKGVFVEFDDGTSLFFGVAQPEQVVSELKAYVAASRGEAPPVVAIKRSA